MGDASGADVASSIADGPHTSTNITIKPLHPTFGAELGGVDFSKPLLDETFAEIEAAIAKVLSTSISQQQQ